MVDFKFNIEAQTSPGWIERAERCAQLILPLREMFDGPPSIADMGCGDQKLRFVLNNMGFDFAYQGYDINPQSLDVEKFDVDVDDLDGEYDLIIALGLTEYINLRRFLISMRAGCRYFAVSHVLNNPKFYNQNDLTRLGWVNHLSSEDFEGLLIDAGFKIIGSDMTKNQKVKIWLCN